MNFVFMVFSINFFSFNVHFSSKLFKPMLCDYCLFEFIKNCQFQFSLSQARKQMQQSFENLRRRHEKRFEFIKKVGFSGFDCCCIWENYATKLEREREREMRCEMKLEKDMEPWLCNLNLNWICFHSFFIKIIVCCFF